ncbi:hypothetical protein N0M98_11565 [Paenibacillus doosanensis]|uniref:Uncharacterized protein n=1 Tax=Paenibacillus konkukensis TaxID=2020716 RepID=A0ABY4RW97_9BACL|nr:MULTISPECIES: hypothetical protein [Paenibacillus]MCS7460782.1 hypothetical protein [Paenibacillus doosanensis]UQZ85961.1 hypothetical protein SK3146_05253 [Paenibacillus konkukensis]
MKHKFEIDSACLLLGLQLERVLEHFARERLACVKLDGNYYTDESGIEELEKLAPS